MCLFYPRRQAMYDVVGRVPIEFRSTLRSAYIAIVEQAPKSFRKMIRDVAGRKVHTGDKPTRRPFTVVVTPSTPRLFGVTKHERYQKVVPVRVQLTERMIAV
jgi:hypothetical protein